MQHCPNCGHCLSQSDEPLTPAQLLEQACLARGLHVLADGRVAESVAATLLDRSPHTVANWARGDRRLAFVTVSNRRTYYLADIAAFLDAGSE